MDWTDEVATTEKSVASSTTSKAALSSPKRKRIFDENQHFYRRHPELEGSGGGIWHHDDVSLVLDYNKLGLIASNPHQLRHFISKCPISCAGIRGCEAKFVMMY